MQHFQASAVRWLIAVSLCICLSLPAVLASLERPHNIRSRAHSKIQLSNGSPRAHAQRLLLADLELIPGLGPLVPSSSDRFGPDAVTKPTPRHDFEVNVPPRVLPSVEGLTECTITLVNRSFANSYGNPSVLQFSPSTSLPSKCSDASKWVALVLTQSGASIGRQFDRLGSVSIGNPNSNGPVEIWRTDNAEPTAAGVTWSSRKEVSQYYSLFKQPASTIVFDYPNVVDSTYTGILNISLSLTVYQPLSNAKSARAEHVTNAYDAYARREQISIHEDRNVEERSFFATPEPLSARTPDSIHALSGTGKALSSPALSLVGQGVTGTTAQATLSTVVSTFPVNAARAIIEIFASGTAQDEFWYSNAPSSLAEQVPDAANFGLYGGGPYREIQVRVDGNLAGIVSPYAVIFTGGIQPLMWGPESAFGAYNQPTYLVDVTPFIGTLTDGKDHTFDLVVQSADRNGSYPQGWFLSGNLQVVLDPSSKRTTGQLISTPPKSAYLPYPTLVTTNHIKGDITTNGSYSSTVKTRGGKSNNRQMTVVGTVKTGSAKTASMYTWQQSFSYRSDLFGNASVSTSKQTASGKSVLLASSGTNSSNPSIPLYAESFSFPLDTLSAYDGQFLNGSVNHAYKVEVASTESLLGPWLGSGYTSGKKIGLPLARTISTHQVASAYSLFSGSAVIGGVGKTSQN
ncbi:hypothetical protein OC861_004897 [Tilletia horrida]|nr:hypothetical protein OC861_004897 [Tilletia horrida]